MKRKGVIIQGSSRSDGNTHKVVNVVKEKTGFDVVDLKSKNIGVFDYQFKNQQDDFIPLMTEIVEKYDTILFATPVYWFSMSGLMKNFFDRITDCIKIEKEIGRQLKGKSMAMISSGSGPELKEGFTMPFVESASYLGMNYLGDIHTWIEEDVIPEVLNHELTEFVEKLRVEN